MSANKDNIPENNNEKGVEVIYPTPKSTISPIFTNSSTISAKNKVSQTHTSIESNQPEVLIDQLNLFTAHVGTNSDFSSSTTINGKNKKFKSTTTNDQDNRTFYSSNKLNNEFKLFKDLESILERKADDLEKNLLLKQTEAKGALDTSLKSALHDIGIHKTETKEELKETRNSVLGTIALFAAFFTFVSVNVNIFTKAETVTQSIIFMLSFWLCIIGFVSLFFFFLNKTQDTIWYKSLEFYTTILCIFFTTILMYLLFKNTNHDSYQKINEKISKIQSENKELKKENSELNKKISTQLKDIDEQIIELRKNQYQLNSQ